MNEQFHGAARGTKRTHRWRSRLRRFLGYALALTLLVESAGCTRHFFRNRADEEVVEVLTEKDQYENARIENFHVYPNERARFADPSDPDHPPKPPDDPAAYDLSPNPQKPGKGGVARIEGTGYLELIALWDRENRERQLLEEAAEKQKTTEPPPEEEQEARQ